MKFFRVFLALKLRLTPDELVQGFAAQTLDELVAQLERRRARLRFNLVEHAQLLRILEHGLSGAVTSKPPPDPGTFERRQNRNAPPFSLHRNGDGLKVDLEHLRT